MLSSLWVQNRNGSAKPSICHLESSIPAPGHLRSTSLSRYLPSTPAISTSLNTAMGLDLFWMAEPSASGEPAHRPSPSKMLALIFRDRSWASSCDVEVLQRSMRADFALREERSYSVVIASVVNQRLWPPWRCGNLRFLLRIFPPSRKKAVSCASSPVTHGSAYGPTPSRSFSARPKPCLGSRQLGKNATWPWMARGGRSSRGGNALVPCTYSRRAPIKQKHRIS